MGENAEQKLDSLNEAMLGTFEKPGLVSLVRDTNHTVMLLKSQVEKMQSDVDDLKSAKIKLVGIVTGAGIVSGGIGAKIAGLFHS